MKYLESMPSEFREFVLKTSKALNTDIKLRERKKYPATMTICRERDRKILTKSKEVFT
jgi:hypothetical protein